MRREKSPKNLTVDVFLADPSFCPVITKAAKSPLDSISLNVLRVQFGEMNSSSSRSIALNALAHDPKSAAAAQYM